MRSSIVFLLVALIWPTVFAQSTNSGHRVEIVTIAENGSFVLKLDDLNSVLSADGMKDRDAVVVSVVGANVPLKNTLIQYLNAQYKKHNLVNWFDGNANQPMWESSNGISMWSEVFTHGDKIAIILLDAQSRFDANRSITEQCTSLFAVSTLLSSVQCYSIQDHSQDLLFITRNWQYNDDTSLVETRFGEGDLKFVEDNDYESPVILQMIQRIKMSLEKIDTFAQNIDNDVAKDLVPSILAPENLIVKQINGNKLLVKDFVHNLQVYVEALAANHSPTSLHETVANSTNFLLSLGDTNRYISLMNQSLDTSQSYVSDAELLDFHQMAKNQSLAQFQNTPKIGSDNLKNSYFQQTDQAIERNFITFRSANMEKRAMFLENPVQNENLQNEKLILRLQQSFEMKVLQYVNDSNVKHNYDDLMDFVLTSKQTALDEFNNEKVGDESATKTHRQKLEKSLQDFEVSINQAFTFSMDILTVFNDTIQSKFNEVDFLPQQKFDELQQNGKDAAISQFLEKSNVTDDKLVSTIQGKIENDIQQLKPKLSQQNEEKRKDFNDKSKITNEETSERIRSSMERKLITELDQGKTELLYNDWLQSFTTAKQNALAEFESLKVGEEWCSAITRDKLERNLNSLRQTMETSFVIYRDCMNLYSTPLQKLIDETATYVPRNQLTVQHEDKKAKALAQFIENPILSNSAFITALEHRIQSGIDLRYEQFKEDIERGRTHYIKHHMVKMGWMKITINEVTAASHADGKKCDPFGPCDPYIKLFIDGRMVHHTQTFINQKIVFVGETYISPKMSKSAAITIELWDYDLLDADDLILSWNTNVDELMADGVVHVHQGYGENKIVTMTTWREENIDS